MSQSVAGDVPLTAPHAVQRSKAGLLLACLGIVYGDIGTSPLYAVRECFHGAHAAPLDHASVLGVLSLVFWALTLCISIKYIGYVLQADNKGEGGILALAALLAGTGLSARYAKFVTALAVFGAALLYGDGVITPAISVMSAVEGIKVKAPALEAWVIPLTVVILTALFAVQSRGTARVGAVFGPITLLWFIAIGVVGLGGVISEPGVLAAVNPVWGVRFFFDHGAPAFLVLGAVLLTITGGEALYADMGHFGSRPIRITWFAVAMPALLLNYFGQGALLLRDASAAENPFYHLVPDWAQYPMIALATAAAIIASQAMISGAFSLTRQAIMLGYLPRLQVRHTSTEYVGQIYVPAANWIMLVFTLALVLGFRSSTNLAASYGIAVTFQMTVTTVLASFVARRVWGWPAAVAIGISLVFLVPDTAFLAANLAKIGQGGWVPLVIGAVLFTMMTTWKKGRALMAARFLESTVDINDFYELMRIERPARVAGTAVFMVGTSEGLPPALMRNFLHNRVVHEHNVLLTVVTMDSPRAPPAQRITINVLEQGFVRVTARFGFSEEPDIPTLLRASPVPGYQAEYATFFLGRETILASKRGGMWRIRKRLFGLMSQVSQQANLFFRLPADKVVEIGSQVEL